MTSSHRLSSLVASKVAKHICLCNIGVNGLKKSGIELQRLHHEPILTTYIFDQYISARMGKSGLRHIKICNNSLFMVWELKKNEVPIVAKTQQTIRMTHEF